MRLLGCVLSGSDHLANAIGAPNTGYMKHLETAMAAVFLQVLFALRTGHRACSSSCLSSETSRQARSSLRKERASWVSAHALTNDYAAHFVRRVAVPPGPLACVATGLATVARRL